MLHIIADCIVYSGSLFHILSIKSNFRDRAMNLPAREFLLKNVEILTTLFAFWENRRKYFEGGKGGRRVGVVVQALLDNQK